MTEVYRKRGRVVRWENGWLVRVVEHGEAIDDGVTFRCHPLPHKPEEPAGTIAAPVLKAERIIVTEGFAEHEFGDVRWSEHTRRVHVALVHDRLRALVDLASFDFDEVQRIAGALARAGAERDAPKHLRLAPNVSAALLPHLGNIVQLTQVAGGVDGKGQPIVETIGTNWYRPSYRVRPVRVPMNIRATPNVTSIDDDLPRAIAILGASTYVLIEDGPTTYPAKLNVARIDAVADEIVFYPYAAGSFGAEMMF